MKRITPNYISLSMKQALLLLLSGFLFLQADAQYVYTIKADSVKLTACDSTELIIENHTQGVPGFLYNKGNGRTEFRRVLIKLNDSTYLMGTDTLKAGGPQYWAANGTHIYNLNPGNVGIRRSQPLTTLDLPGAVNVDDTSSYQINYHPMIKVADMESGVYMSLFVGDSSGRNLTGVQNTAVGGYAGSNAAGDGNTSVGNYAGYNVQVPPENPSLGQYNTNVGLGAGSYTVGGLNTYIGAGAGGGYNGSFNTITGEGGGGNPIIGDYNSIYGALAGGWSAGAPNCYFGYESGYTSTGSSNTFMGTTAGSYLIGGNKNVFIGDSSCNGWFGEIAGDFNTIIGANTTMEYNDNYCILLGAGATAVSYINNSAAIGSGTTIGTSNTMVFGNGSVQSWLLGLNTPVSGRALIVGSNSGNGNGAYLTSGGVWTNASDRNKKENFQSLSENDILVKISQLPVTRWNYKGLSEQHIGPVAQDFHRIFDVGSDDKTISTIDPAGIALAGIQGLYHRWLYAESKAATEATRVKEQQSEIDLLRSQVQGQKKEMQQILDKLNNLETAISRKEKPKGDLARTH
jgi:hypothetical protein